jgi:hypothetical protein
MGIKFFRKNKIDLDYSGVDISITDAVASDKGDDFVHFLRNRNNTSGWATTGSSDAANTQIDIDMGSRKDVDCILLVEMNFKNYTIQYYDEDLASWTNFSTSINVTNNTTATRLHTFNSVSARLFRIIITATFVANADKFMTQLIITEALGEFSFQPRIKPVIDRSRKATKYLSGRSHIIKSIAAFEVAIEMQGVTADVDLSLVENLFDSYEGFIVWLCGGTITQYDTERIGYRLKDLYLVNVANEYRPEWGQSRYKNGIEVDLKLLEVI